MPQLRKDPIAGRWVIVATERARRPASFVDPLPTATDAKDCPFCQDRSLVQVHAHGGVKVVKSGSPILDSTKPFARQGHGLYDVCHSYGAHEVVIEAPQHIANMADLSLEQIKHVFETYALRLKEHRKDPFIEYVLAYKNYGVAAGSRNIGHARSQIMAVPVLPMRVTDKIHGAEGYFNYHERCLFAICYVRKFKTSNALLAPMMRLLLLHLLLHAFLSRLGSSLRIIMLILPKV